MKLLLVPIALVMLSLPITGRAEAFTPRHDYPLTNRGTCELLKDMKWDVKGASSKQVRGLCEREGISL